MADAPLTAFAINCSLRPSGQGKPSSTDKMLRDTLDALAEHGVTGEIVRAADHDIKHGVHSDMGDGDAWPELRRRLLAADIFVLGLPIWMGQPSSIAKKILERIDAFLGETDDRARMPATGKVALVAVVGNEDDAHHCHAACFQALGDVGFTIPANAGIYWVGRRWARPITAISKACPTRSRRRSPPPPRTRASCPPPCGAAVSRHAGLSASARDRRCARPRATAPTRPACKRGNMEFVFGLIILVLDIYAIVKILGSSASTGAKILWVLLILFLPVIGLVIWWFAGPKGSADVT